MFGFNALDLFGGQFVAPGASLAAAYDRLRFRRGSLVEDLRSRVDFIDQAA